MSARTKTPKTFAEYKQLPADDQYYIWLIGDVPAHWWVGDESSCQTAATEVSNVTYVDWWQSYVPTCDKILGQVEDAIREVNPDLANTSRLIEQEDK